MVSGRWGGRVVEVGEIPLVDLVSVVGGRLDADGNRVSTWHQGNHALQQPHGRHQPPTASCLMCQGQGQRLYRSWEEGI